ncbi:MAG: hypothetical protein JSR80_03755 [Verrucomicrobia bacterium]|nr:hypothetical protein [Verrucomicrobiota bacterium]
MTHRLLKFCTSICVLAALSITPLVAQTCSAPCWDACDWGADFAVGVDALYWKPLHCDYVIGRKDITGVNSTVSNIFAITADYAWGVRTYASYARDCNFIDASYLWFQAHDTFFPGDGLISNVASNSTARPVGRLFFQYQNVDLRLGQILHKGCGCSFYVFADARWAFINERRQLNAIVISETNSNLEIIHKSTFSGAGVGVGMGGQFSIWNCFSGFGRLTALSLIGNRQTPIESMISTDPITQRVKFRSNTCIIPAIDVRLGLDYQWECGCLSTVWEVGYELDYYFQVLNTVNEQSNSLGVSSQVLRSCKNIGFAGPYAGVKLLF